MIPRAKTPAPHIGIFHFSIGKKFGIEIRNRRPNHKDICIVIYVYTIAPTAIAIQNTSPNVSKFFCTLSTN